MTFRSIAIGLSAAVLAGCSMIPTYERPEAPVPAAFPYAGAATGTAATELQWRQFFADARLAALVETALRNNRDLRIAALNIAQARAQYDIRQADLLPGVGVSGSASRAPNALREQTTSYSVNLGISAWEIDFFGRISSLSEAALAQYLGTEEGRRAAQAALVASVANTWLNLAADEELLAITEQTLRSREESQRLTRLRFEGGAASELDFRQAESLTESARATLAQLRRQRALDLNTLGLLIGEAVSPEYRVGITTQSVTLPDLPAGVPSEVLTQRPDVRQAEQQLLAANANIGAARAAFFPRISLTAGIGTVSPDLSGLFDGGNWGYTVTPSLLQPIFDAGRNRAGLDSARVSRDIAVAQYERAIQTAFREVADGLAGRTTLADLVASQGRVVEAESVRLRLAQLRYEGGVSSYLDYLDAQRSLFAAQQALVQARLARLQNQVQLYRALGGGWAE